MPAFAQSTGSRFGAAVIEARIIPVEYSPEITSTPRTPIASWASWMPASVSSSGLSMRSPGRSRGAAAAAGSAADWAPNQWWLGWRNRWDVVNRWWNQGVIGFDTLRQHGLLTPFGLRNTDPGMLGLLLAVGGSLFAALGLAWAMWKRPVADPAKASMQLLEKRLASVGVVRRHSEGPQHYFQRASRAIPTRRAELEHLMKCYLELRYAHDEPPPGLLKNFRQAVRDFRPRRMVK